MTDVLIKGEVGTQRPTQGEEDVKTQGRDSHQQAKKGGRGQILPHSPQDGPTLLTPCPWASSLQGCETHISVYAPSVAQDKQQMETRRPELEARTHKGLRWGKETGRNVASVPHGEGSTATEPAVRPGREEAACQP